MYNAEARLPTTTVRDRIYKKQEEEASMAAILWRKKLVLHRSLAGVSIGISQNPIMHAPIPSAQGDPLSRAEENERSPGTTSRRPEKQASPGAGQFGYDTAAGGRSWWTTTGALELKFEEMERGLLIGAGAGWVDDFALRWQR
ncbi:hypothetical protein GQ55_1G385800 [Panicum hallii var. hallii]|uniref:Uncharacterized protein n=2 Tax=Panicum hallii TaxID=206008 RepID=A0A2T7FC02_9POAL|nr:hypothetical protein GQ55_1G385800 [Panicum hallii var. hallii]